MQKYLYALQSPQRWDVVVFKYPQNPSQNFIKRLVGLPNEQIMILDGNIYTRPSGQPDHPWRIARKDDRPEVQRTLWQPVYDSRYYPLDGGESTQRRETGHRWRFPWYHQNGPWRQNELGSVSFEGGRGRLQFDLAEQIQRVPLPYNQLKNNPGRLAGLEEIRLAAEIRPHQPGLTASLATTARIDGAALEPVTATLTAEGHLSLSVGRKGALHYQVHEQMPLPAGRTTRLELWVVDHAVSVWRDGRRVAHWRFEVSPSVLMNRPATTTLPNLSVSLSGPAATVERLQVDRDLQYTANTASQTKAGRGAVVIGRFGTQGGPFDIGPDAFFVLGDNTNQSSDSRAWNKIDPWVEQLLSGRANPEGIVPRPLMMGRAFFVYYPPSHPVINPRLPGIPNFGDMRFIH